MTKKYRIDLHKTGRLNSIIAAMIANHNNGKVSFNLIDVVGLLNSLKSAYPEKNSGYAHQWNTQSPSGTQLILSEDNGETFTMTITQVEVHELNNASDLAQNTEA